MINRKALLIGVSSYTSKNITNLPRVDNDISALNDVFNRSKYFVQAFHTESTTTRARILIEVSNFLNQCSPSDIAIIYLSGHGLHLNGKDYFVPSDADDLANNPAIIPDLLVEVSFKNLVKHCKASTVILIVDACREGAEITPPDKTKSMNLSQWGDGAKADSENKQNVFVFSCTSGQLSQFETEEAGLSIFTRALVNILTPDHPAKTLGEVLQDLGPETSRVCEKEKLQNQIVKIVGEFPSGGYSEFRQEICLGSSRTNSIEITGELYNGIQNSPLWSSAIDKSTPELDLIKKEVEKFAIWCSSVKPNVNDVSLTSFHDDRFFLRCLNRLELMLYHPRKKLSCLELGGLFSAILLAELHYLKSSSRLTMSLGLQSKNTNPRGKFLKRNPVFERYCTFAQAFLNPDDIENLIEEYSLEWAYCNENTFKDELKKGYLGSDNKELDELVAGLDFLKDVGGDVLQNIASCFIKLQSIGSLFEKFTYREGSYDAQIFRAKTLGEISYISGRMAIHIGSFDSGFAAMISANKPVIPSMVFNTLNKVKWIATDDKQSLSVECDSSILDELIQQHVHLTNSKITGFQKSSLGDEESYLQIVKGFKSFVSDRLIASSVDGHLSYIKPHVKIRLEDNKMRDLLMGDQLYGDPNLALRELYQNAQDACQIRKARVQYLAVKNKSLASWEPKVSIRLSYDESGQGFIECEDNGSGMSLDLLKNCFTFAGHKLTDTSLFIQEQQQWQVVVPSVKAHLISRFGIGVLSYFMLSNEIHVYTRHFTSSGELSETAYSLILYMSSEITSISQSDKLLEGGTIVRLMLRPEVISGFDVDQLLGDAKEDNLEMIFKKFLGSNCFQLQLSENNKTINYPAGDLLFKSKKNVLSFLNLKLIPDKINIDREEEIIKFTEKAMSYKESTLDAEYKSKNGDVWFYESGEGYVLADGMLTDITYPYVTVNLVGEDSPRLSVDRKHVQNLDKSLVESKLLKSISDVLNAPWITADWIWRFAEQWPLVADQLYGSILENFKEKAFPLRLPIDENDHILHIKLSKCGLFSHDRDLIPVLEGGLPESFKLSPMLTVSRLRALKRAIDDKSYAVMDTDSNKNLFNERENRVWFWQEVLSKALSKKCNEKSPWVVGEIESLVIIKLAVSNELSIASLVKEFVSLEETAGAFILESTATQLAGLQLDDISIKYIQEYVKLGWHKVSINRSKLMQISSDMKVPVRSIFDSFSQLEQVGVISFTSECSTVEDALFQEKDIQIFEALTLGADLSKTSENLLQKHLLFEKKRILAGSGRTQVSLAETIAVCKKIAEFYKVDFNENFTCSHQIIAPQLTQYLRARNPDDATKLLESEFSASHILRFCSHYLISLDVFVSDYSFFFEEVGDCSALEIVQNSGFDPISVEDRKLVSLKLNGKRPWISGKVPEAHILQASSELKVPINKLINKMQLWEQAFRISTPTITVENKYTVADELVGKALSRNLNGAHPWVSIGTLIDELAVRAFLLDIPCSQLISSCGKYFCEIKESKYLDICVNDAASSIIVNLKEFAMHRMQSGVSDLFPIKIPILKVYEISTHSGKTTDDILEVIRLLPQCFTTDWDETDNSKEHRLPTEKEKQLLFNISNVKNKGSKKGQKELAELILNLAVVSKVSPNRVVEYIEQLKQETGLVEGEMPDTEGLESSLTDTDVLLLNKNIVQADDWLSGTVSMGHILYGSWKLGVPIKDCVNTVRKFENFLSLRIDEAVGKLNPSRTADRLDVYLISQNFDGKLPWKSNISDSDLGFASMVLDIPKLELESCYARLFCGD